MSKEECLFKLTYKLLTDEHGISEEAYEELYSLLESFNLDYIAHYVDATDGRYYIPEQNAAVLQEAHAIRRILPDVE